jgi:hypothetical protein
MADDAESSEDIDLQAKAISDRLSVPEASGDLNHPGYLGAAGFGGIEIGAPESHIPDRRVNAPGADLVVGIDISAISPLGRRIVAPSPVFNDLLVIV